MSDFVGLHRRLDNRIVFAYIDFSKVTIIQEHPNNETCIILSDLSEPIIVTESIRVIKGILEGINKK